VASLQATNTTNGYKWGIHVESRKFATALLLHHVVLLRVTTCPWDPGRRRFATSETRRILERPLCRGGTCIVPWQNHVHVCVFDACGYVCVWPYLWNIKEERVCDSSVFFHIWYNLPGVTRCLVAAVHLGRMPISTLSDQMEVCPCLKSDGVHTLFCALSR